MGRVLGTLALALAVAACTIEDVTESGAPPGSGTPATPTETGGATATPDVTAAPAPADLVFRGGPILTMTPAGTAAALAIRDGRIVAVGGEDLVAPLIGPATTTPTKTAKAHAVVMTIHPELFALDLASRTPATTASPRRTRSPVPKISAMTMLVSQTMLRTPS